MAKKKKTGLGRGLDSLIPVFSEDDESEENSSLTLEDMLKEKDEKKDKASKKSKSRKNSNNDSKSTKSAEKTDSEKPKGSKISEKTDNKEELNSSKDIIAEKQVESFDVETKNSKDSSPITKANQSTSEVSKTSDEESNGLVETSQNVVIKEEVVEVVKVTETESDVLQDSGKITEDIMDNLTEREKQSIDEVIKIIGKNPRITLWSAKSAAVFRYLRKTEPEFSISKEASRLIDEAVQAKYPEIWALFKNIEK